MIYLAVCTTPRTGSNYLKELLAENIGGDLDEYLHMDLHGWRTRDFNTVEKLWENHTVNDVFAIKLHWEHREHVYSIADFDEVLPPGGKWIFLTRDDVEAQAKSWNTACVRDKWRVSSKPYTTEGAEVFERRIRRQNEDWEHWFARKGLEPLHITFEELTGDPKGTIERIRGFIS